MPISKTFEFYETFNYQIMKIKESGILKYIQHVYEDKYGGIHRTCESSAQEKGSPIDLHTVISAVAIFISGLGASILLLPVEMCWRFYKARLEREEPYSTDTESTTGEIRISRMSVESVSTIILK